MDEIQHGMWEEQETTRTVGSKIGTATVKMDTHTLAYILKGLNGRVGTFEMMVNKGPLADDDRKSFDYTVELRDNVESTRNKTLRE